MIKNVIAERIIWLRSRTGLNQEQFGAKVDLSKSAVWRMEKGEHMPGGDVVANLCEKMGVSADWFLLGRGQPFWNEAPESVASNATSEVKESLQGGEIADGSDVDSLLRIAEFVGINGPVTELQLKEGLAMSAEDVARLCLILFRRRVLKQVAAGWSLQKEGVFRVDETSEVADLGRQALKLMEERIVFGARGHRGALAVADVRIAGDEPGERVMTAIWEALLRIESQEGRIQKVVVGVTPALDEDEK